MNHNAAAGTEYNVYQTYEECGVRVWLHQNRDWQDGGWAYCLTGGQEDSIPAAYQHPLNIYISDNGSFCGAPA